MSRVAMTVNGKSELKSLRIDPSLLKPEEAEIVEDLIVTAYGDARQKAEAALAEKMRAMTGGLAIRRQAGRPQDDLEPVRA